MKGTEYTLYGPKNIPWRFAVYPKRTANCMQCTDSEINVRGILPSQGLLIRAFL